MSRRRRFQTHGSGSVASPSSSKAQHPTTSGPSSGPYPASSIPARIMCDILAHAPRNPSPPNGAKYTAGIALHQRFDAGEQIVGIGMSGILPAIAEKLIDGGVAGGDEM